ncbi:heme-binding protein [Spartinivicinus marinus]|uniref:heme-binding protein n=1 Tax=Spartinivicinus marinus TaxID=2994442 RepID=UPI001C5C95B2|nr:heme-binding protein [Spartinivicinus marinus]MCX4026598.1 heme-binding protein [Spartinivicinus marinus]
MDRPTADFANLIKKKPELAGLRDMDPNILILGGGLPINANGQKIGGIGVGGAPGGILIKLVHKRL